MAQEMTEFLSDLGDWTNEVQHKDDALKSGKALHGTVAPAAAPAAAPEPRGRVSNTVKGPAAASETKADGKRAKAKALEADAKAKASAAGHTYDYFKDKWDKFDVDAALEDVDDDSEDEGSKKKRAGGFWAGCGT